jgi:hypothetical protein
MRGAPSASSASIRTRTRSTVKTPGQNTTAHIYKLQHAHTYCTTRIGTWDVRSHAFADPFRHSPRTRSFLFFYPGFFTPVWNTPRARRQKKIKKKEGRTTVSQDPWRRNPLISLFFFPRSSHTLASLSVACRRPPTTNGDNMAARRPLTSRPMDLFYFVFFLVRFTVSITPLSTTPFRAIHSSALRMRYFSWNTHQPLAPLSFFFFGK